MKKIIFIFLLFPFVTCPMNLTPGPTVPFNYGSMIQNVATNQNLAAPPTKQTNLDLEKNSIEPRQDFNCRKCFCHPVTHFICCTLFITFFVGGYLTLGNWS